MDLARELVLRVDKQATVRNWKGALLEMGGSVTWEFEGFVATAFLHGVSAQSSVWPTKRAAERDAAEAVLCEMDLSSDADRGKYKLARAKEAMAKAAVFATAELDAEWLKAGHDMLFEQLTVSAASVRGTEDAEWFLRGMRKRGSAFSRIMSSPVALSAHVLNVHAWGAKFGDEESCMALMVVTMRSGLTQWFVCPPQTSMTKARESVSLLAICGMGLVEFAGEC